MQGEMIASFTAARPLQLMFQDETRPAYQRYPLLLATIGYYWLRRPMRPMVKSYTHAPVHLRLWSCFTRRWAL
jgi:hypothetical protein